MNLLRLLKDAGCAAAIFDMDGVVTETTGLHARAWKQTFDELLATLATASMDFKPFDLMGDYRNHVDGRTRIAGITTFLASRGIALPLGNENDSSPETIHGLATRKNRLYLENLAEYGVTVHNDAIDLIKALRQASVKIGLATSSKNAALVLEMAGLRELFDVVVDGNDVQDAGLPSKPAPDIFIFAAQRLTLPITSCAVFEDSREAILEIEALSPARAIWVCRDGGQANVETSSKLTFVTDLGCH